MSEEETQTRNHFPIEDYEKLFARAFPDVDPAAPVLGATDDIEIAPNLAALLANPEVTVAELEKDGQLAGFSLAMPIGTMDPARQAEATETAYIYYTALDPAEQGQGHVGPLMKIMEEKLRAQGYSYVEEDCMTANGYADSVQKNYADAIVESRDHIDFPEIGSQRFFRIDLREVPNA